jgi:hypothetical protein
MSAEIGVFLRGDRVVVVPRGGGGGLSWDADPPVVVPQEPAPTGEAIVAGLATSRQLRMAGAEPPAGAGTSRSPMLRALGFKSYKEFYRGAAYCFLYEETPGGELLMFKFVPARNGKGFDGAPDPTEVIDDPGHAAERVLGYLREAPAMPG